MSDQAFGLLVYVAGALLFVFEAAREGCGEMVAKKGSVATIAIVLGVILWPIFVFVYMPIVTAWKIGLKVRAKTKCAIAHAEAIAEPRKSETL